MIDLPIPSTSHSDAKFQLVIERFTLFFQLVIDKNT